jgi:hypothetical protein
VGPVMAAGPAGPAGPFSHVVVNPATAEKNVFIATS